MNQSPREISKVIREPAYLIKAVRDPIRAFIHTEEVGALFLLAAAAVAIVWINSPWSESYEEFWHTKVSFDLHIFAISEDLRHLVNEGLMAVFFFVVGLEIKREVMHGELSSFRKAALPGVAAIGGMAVPALIYIFFNQSGDGVRGWGVPMATDIAFAIGVLALLGRRVPTELRVFLLALVVVDDLGAIAVVAIFYAKEVDWVNLVLGLAVFGVIAASVRLGARSIAYYIVLCVIFWLLFLESGIHSTIAGVFVAAIVPSSPRIKREDFVAAVQDRIHDLKLAISKDDDDKAQSMVAQIDDLSRDTEEPLERLEEVIHPWVSFLILPVFALANAGIVFTSDSLSDSVESPIALGIAVALLAGKSIGIFSFTWLAVRLGLGQLPGAVGWMHVLGIGFLAGIGFTVAIFITGIAFEDPVLIDQAKFGIFGASIIAGLVGYLVLRIAGRRGSV